MEGTAKATPMMAVICNFVQQPKHITRIHMQLEGNAALQCAVVLVCSQEQEITVLILNPGKTSSTIYGSYCEVIELILH